MGRVLLLLLAVLIYIIASLHLLAHWLFLYWTYWWLDSVMHTLAGVWIGLFVLWLAHHSPYSAIRKKFHAQSDGVLVFVTAAVFGVLWEAYQLTAHVVFSIPFKPNHAVDSISDVLFGMAGAGLALLLYRLFARERSLPEGDPGKTE
jgi:hypothetical protein